MLGGCRYEPCYELQTSTGDAGNVDFPAICGQARPAQQPEEPKKSALSTSKALAFNNFPDLQAKWFIRPWLFGLLLGALAQGCLVCRGVVGPRSCKLGCATHYVRLAGCRLSADQTGLVSADRRVGSPPMAGRRRHWAAGG